MIVFINIKNIIIVIIRSSVKIKGISLLGLFSILPNGELSCGETFVLMFVLVELAFPNIEVRLVGFTMPNKAPEAGVTKF